VYDALNLSWKYEAVCTLMVCAYITFGPKTTEMAFQDTSQYITISLEAALESRDNFGTCIVRERSG
jgi:hypothetical protein